MRFTTKATVVGIKTFTGEVEGSQYDNTTIFALMEQDESKGTAVGYAVSEFKFASSELFRQLKSHKFPTQAELDLELSSNGKVQKTVLRAVRVLAPVDPVSGVVNKAG